MNGFDYSFDEYDEGVNPADAGVPTAMPSNNWWDLGEQLITSARDVAIVKATSGTRAAPGGRIAAPGNNQPPGQFGLRPQANAAPGGAIDQAQNRVAAALPKDWAWMLAFGVVIAIGIFAMIRQGRS